MTPSRLRRFLLALALVSLLAIAAKLLGSLLTQTGGEHAALEINPAPKISFLPREWKDEIFKLATSREVIERERLVVLTRPEWVKHGNPRPDFDIHLTAADGVAYTYAYGMDEHGLLEVRIEYPREGIYMIMYAHYSDLKLRSARGNTALFLDPSISRKKQKNEFAEWQGRFNGALIALGNRIGKPPPEGVWQ